MHMWSHDECVTVSIYGYGSETVFETVLRLVGRTV